MFEKKNEKVVVLSVFVKRMILHVALATILIMLALLMGIVGYHWVAGLSWIDSILNASMILGGMGPVNVLTTVAGKIFASMYALFSGLFFIGIMGVVLTPVVHRMLHTFHVEDRK